MAAGLLAMGIAAAGFLAYNKLEDLEDWLKDQWEDGFGLSAEPAVVQDGIANQTAPVGTRTPTGFEGMNIHQIYEIHYNERSALLMWISQQWAAWNGLEWTGATHDQFLDDTTRSTLLRTYRFERNELITTSTAKNEISEYAYQMIIRETAYRNAQARITSGVVGAISTGIGAAFSEATHWALRTSGFMQKGDWDGLDWRKAPGANLDPLLDFAWARTDFKTGDWWSTVDSVGDVAFWLDRAEGVGGYTIGSGAGRNPEGFKKWTYEQVIHAAFNELESADYTDPFLTYLLESVAVGYIEPSPEPVAPSVPTGDAPSDEAEEESRRDQEQSSNESGRDDYMPGEDAPPDDEEQYGPPRQ